LLRLTSLTGQASCATLLRKGLLSRQALLAWATWATWAAELGLAARTLLAELLLLTWSAWLTRGAWSGPGLAWSGAALLALLDLRRSTGPLLG